MGQSHSRKNSKNLENLKILSEILSKPYQLPSEKFPLNPLQNKKPHFSALNYDINDPSFVSSTIPTI